MSDATTTDALRTRAGRLAPDRITLLWGGLVVLVELLLVFVYLQVAPVYPTAYRFYVYPFVWINVGLWAVAVTDPPTADRSKRIAGAAVAAGYFLLLAWVGGLLGPGYAFQPASTPGLYTSALSVPPGWGPIAVLDTAVLKLTFMPYKVLGYLALSYLVYVLVLDAVGAGAAFGGVLGLLSCVSCTWPVLATLASGALGSASSITAAVYSGSYGLSTAVFVLTVGLLVWRPTLR